MLLEVLDRYIRVHLGKTAELGQINYLCGDLYSQKGSGGGFPAGVGPGRCEDYIELRNLL